MACLRSWIASSFHCACRCADAVSAWFPLPDWLLQAFAVYRETFQPSAQLARPYAMATVNLVAADTDAAARRLFSSHQQAFVRLRRGQPGRLPPPVDRLASSLAPEDLSLLQQVMRYSFVGSPATLEQSLSGFLRLAQPDDDVMAHDRVGRSVKIHSEQVILEVILLHHGASCGLLDEDSGIHRLERPARAAHLKPADDRPRRGYRDDASLAGAGNHDPVGPGQHHAMGQAYRSAIGHVSDR